MSTEVIIVNDTSDVEPFNDYDYTSGEDEVVVLSVSSPIPEPPSSSQPPSDTCEAESLWDYGTAAGDSDSEAESLDAACLSAASQSQTTASRRSPTASGAYWRSQTHGDVSNAPENTEQKKSLASRSFDSDSSLVVEPSKKPVKRRMKKTEEEKAHEKAEKERKRLSKKEETRAKKEAAAAKKAAEKIVKKAHKDANKLVSDKKTTLKDMTIEHSPSLLSSPIYAPLHEKMQEFGCSLVSVMDGNAIVQNPVTNHETNLNTLGIKLIRWKRRVTAIYNEYSRQWFPLEQGNQFTRIEGTYLIFVPKHDIFCRPSFVEQVAIIRQALGPRHHIHLMLCGWKPSRKEEREAVERELVRLQVRENVFVEQVANEDEAVNWIYNMTADLGIKPHKLIERSHLSICAVSSASMQVVGKSDEETMIRMLTQLPRLTDPMARSLVREYGTMNRIMEAFNEAEERYDGTGPMMLADIEVHRTKKGKESPQVLNKALSERIYSLLWGKDPKALLN